MIARRLVAGTLAALFAGAGSSAVAEIEVPRVLATMPTDNAVLTNDSGEFYVRFDRPVDHIRSMMYIRQGDQIVRTLHPRFKTEPDVLFAIALPLPSGDYTFLYSVRTLEGTEMLRGEVPFAVSTGR